MPQRRRSRCDQKGRGKVFLQSGVHAKRRFERFMVFKPVVPTEVTVPLYAVTAFLQKYVGQK